MLRYAPATSEDTAEPACDAAAADSAALRCVLLES
jgi:hypothetical protein